eukprot:2130763-Rhodomonas_salina.1
MLLCRTVSPLRRTPYCPARTRHTVSRTDVSYAATPCLVLTLVCCYAGVLMNAYGSRPELFASRCVVTSQYKRAHVTVQKKSRHSTEQDMVQDKMATLRYERGHVPVQNRLRLGGGRVQNSPEFQEGLKRTFGRRFERKY